MSMPLRPFGTTGLSFPVLSMGCGFPFGFGGFEQAIAAVRRAHALGIRYFDNAPVYRSGAAQAIVGEGLSAIPAAEQPFVATKVGHLKEGRHFRSVEALFVQLHENLRLLRRESVDLLQVHEADWENWWLDRSNAAPCVLFDVQKSYDFRNAPVVQFLHQARARGLCRYVGITGNNARHLTRLVREVPGMDSVLAAYNTMPLNASAREDLIPAVTERGLAVVAAGLFTFIHRIPVGWRTEGTYFGKHADEQLVQLQKLQREAGMAMEELVLRWALSEKGISTLLVGACLPAEVEQNIAAVMKGPLPADVHAAVEAIAGSLSGRRRGFRQVISGRGSPRLLAARGSCRA